MPFPTQLTKLCWSGTDWVLKCAAFQNVLNQLTRKVDIFQSSGAISTNWMIIDISSDCLCRLIGSKRNETKRHKYSWKLNWSSRQCETSRYRSRNVIRDCNTGLWFILRGAGFKMERWQDIAHQGERKWFGTRDAFRRPVTDQGMSRIADQKIRNESHGYDSDQTDCFLEHWEIVWHWRNHLYEVH
jgi:hypothetical protein